MLRREEGNVLSEALNFEADSRRERGRSKNTWKKKVEKEIGLTKKNATNCVRCRKSLHIMMRINEVNPAISLERDNTTF